MPRVPTAAPASGAIPFTRSGSIAAPVAAFKALTDVTSQVTGIRNQFEAKLAEARRKDAFIKVSSEFSRGLTEIERTAESPEQFAIDADAFRETISDGIEDPEVRLSFDERSTFAIDAKNATVTARASREQRAGARSFMATEALPAFAEAAATADNAGNDVDADLQMRDAVSFIKLSDHFTEDEKTGLMIELETKRQTDRVQLLIGQALSDPSNAGTSLAKASIILDDFSDAIDPAAKNTLRRSIKSAGNGAALRNKAAIDDVRRAQSDDFLDRIHSGDLSDFPSIPEVLRSNLSRIEKEHFIEIVEAHNNGEDVVQGVASVEAELTDAVHNPNAFNKITTEDQLVPFLGNGLGTEAFTRLSGDLRRKASPDTKLRESQFSAFLTSAKGTLLDTSQFAANDPAGAAAFNDFSIAAREEFDKGISDGKSVSALLSSTGPDSIRNILPNFIQSMTEKQRAAMDVTFPQQAVKTTKLAPAKGESADEFYLRLQDEKRGR